MDGGSIGPRDHMGLEKVIVLHPAMAIMWTWAVIQWNMLFLEMTQPVVDSINMDIQ